MQFGYFQNKNANKSKNTKSTNKKSKIKVELERSVPSNSQEKANSILNGADRMFRTMQKSNKVKFNQTVGIRTKRLNRYLDSV